MNQEPETSKAKEQARKYDPATLEHLWNVDFEELARAPGLPHGRIREARFILQARVALETRRFALWTTISTIVLAIATVLLAYATWLMAHK